MRAWVSEPTWCLTHGPCFFKSFVVIRCRWAESQLKCSQPVPKVLFENDDVNDLMFTAQSLETGSQGLLIKWPKPMNNMNDCNHSGDRVKVHTAVGVCTRMWRQPLG